MHIARTTHEHGATAKVYTYEAEYEVADEAITWRAEVSQGGTPPQRFSGSVPLTSPAVASLAEQAVRDAILNRIDSFDDQHGAALDGVGTAP